LPAGVPSYAPADLIEDASNAEALAWLRRPHDWPFGRLAVCGPPRAGKTHLLRWAAARHGWSLLPAGGLAARGALWPATGTGGAVLDDADRGIEESTLFHLINLCAERGQALLLAAREPPARWSVALPDLRSRLRATTAVALGPPGDALLRALLMKHFADRQLRISASLRDWLVTRLPRDAASMADAAERLDRAALSAGGRLTRALARSALLDLPGFGPHDV
jgi:chromosomal replication initiation ATPase DnaA